MQKKHCDHKLYANISRVENVCNIPSNTESMICIAENRVTGIAVDKHHSLENYHIIRLLISTLFHSLYGY